MAKNFLGKYAFIAASGKMGIVNIDELGARNLFEDTGWMRDYKVFEVMEAKGEVVFHLEDHLKRLSVSMLFSSLPFSLDSRREKPASPNASLDFESKRASLGGPEEIHSEEFLDKMVSFGAFLEKAITKTLEINCFPASLVRVYVTGGWTDDGFSPGGPPNLYILASRFSRPKLKKGEGLRLKTVNYSRQFPLVKNTDYFVAEVVLPHITIGGYDDILYCRDNSVLETSKANFLAVKNGKIITPREGILFGVTRKIVLGLVAKADLRLAERAVSLEELKEADEAFIANTTKGVWPVIKIDEKKLKIGPVTLKLRKIFEDYRKKYYKERGV